MVDRLKVKRIIEIEYTIIPTSTYTAEVIRKQEQELDFEGIASILKFMGSQVATSSVEFEEVDDISE